MLSIDRLRLTLPAGFEARADAVARLVATELAELPDLGLTTDRSAERLTVPPVQAPPGSTDRQVARTVARAIHGELLRGGG